MSSPKLRVIFRPKSEIQAFFPPKIRWSPKKKKKKVFTEIETDFSAEIVRFRLVGGMHPEMETDFSNWRLIFRPKSLVLGWWGGCIPPIPPPKSATDCKQNKWISLNSCLLNLLFVRSHQAEFIMVKRFVRRRNNVTRRELNLDLAITQAVK